MSNIRNGRAEQFESVARSRGPDAEPRPLRLPDGLKGTMSHFGSIATIDITSPSFKRLMKTRGAAPPIGASPGELRLWLKMNGLFDEPLSKVDRRTHLKGMRPRPTKSTARLPPIGERSVSSDVAAMPLPLPGRKPPIGAPSVVADSVDRRSRAMIHGVPHDDDGAAAVPKAPAGRPKARTRAIFPAQESTTESESLAEAEAEAEAKAALARAKAQTQALAEADARAEEHAQAEAEAHAEAEARAEAHAHAQAELAELASAERAAEAEMEALSKQLAEVEPELKVLHELRPEPEAPQIDANEQEVPLEEDEAAHEVVASAEAETSSMDAASDPTAIPVEDEPPLDAADDVEVESDGELDLP